jgi:hypothetical protein
MPPWTHARRLRSWSSRNWFGKLAPIPARAPIKRTQRDGNCETIRQRRSALGLTGAVRGSKTNGMRTMLKIDCAREEFEYQRETGERTSGLSCLLRRSVRSCGQIYRRRERGTLKACGPILRCRPAYPQGVRGSLPRLLWGGDAIGCCASVL